MTTEHDFKKALEAQAETPFGTHRTGGVEIQRMNETIRFALRLADKLLGQEVSKDMAWKGAMGAEDNISASDAKRCFKSMLTTAVKEIKNDRTRSQF